MTNQLKIRSHVVAIRKSCFVFWSDHGYHLGEHNGVWQKRTPFEQDAQAPPIMRSPNCKGHGSTRRIVEFVDIYPTLTDLAGITSPDRLAGRS